MSGKMKKFWTAAVFTVAVFLLMPVSSWGFRPVRPFKFDVSLSGAAGEPDIHQYEFEHRYPNVRNSWDGNHTVEEMYSDRLTDVWYSFGLSADFEAHLARRISVGGEMMLTYMEGKVYHGFETEKHRTVSSVGVYLMPQFRFFYYTTRVTSMSGAVCGGIGLMQGTRRAVCPVYQIKPLALTVGGKLYGKAELTFGNVFNGVNLGVGYRF